jgi:stress response protein YsnF/hemerythrin-like domain-containing protein
MSLRTIMQLGPTKVNELFAKLSETTDGAVKTRERLFAELKAELERHTSLEEQHLFPVLRRNAETKALVADAVRDNRELRAKLAELDALPKNDEGFLEQLKELQRTFRQHARDEKKEFLPAVQQALSEEQLQSVTGKIEASLAEAEQSRQDELQERRAKAREEREQAEQETQRAEASKREEEDAEGRAQEFAHQAADAAMKPVEATVRAASQVARLVTAGPGLDMTSRRAPMRPQVPQLADLLFWPWAGMMQGLQHASTQPASVAKRPSSAEEVVPLGEEVLDVGKRTESRGTARVRRYVVETPVEEQVVLQTERVVVERRRPATDRATGEVLTDLTIEVAETAEVPVVGKRVRLREEVVVRTERSQHVETVRGTVRRDEIEVEQPSKQRGNSQLRSFNPQNR